MRDPIYKNTLEGIEVIENLGDRLRLVHPISGKEVTRRVYRSTIRDNGRNVEYVWIDAVRYFITR